MQPFLKWAGGKRWLVSKHENLLIKNFNRYIEPFLGSGAVFFSTETKRAILADSNIELINTYIAVKENWYDIVKLLEFHQKNHSKNYYYKLRETVNSKNIIEMAARFIYLNRTCWNGLYRVNKKGKFNVPIGTKTKVILPDDDFESIAKKLKTTQLLCQDFEKTINMAMPGDFLFVDPPYTVKHENNGFIKYNEHLFSWSDQERLAKSLLTAKTRGVKILLSNAYHDSIIALYKSNFEIIKVSRASVIAGNTPDRKIVHELLIRS